MCRVIASAIFIRQSPDYSGLFRFWLLANLPAHTSAHTLDEVSLLDQRLVSE
jgi:hypothetical protein